MTIAELMDYGSFYGAAIAACSFIWLIVSRSISKIEAGKNRTIDYEHKKATQLEHEKLQLQKELEKEKQRHVQKLIETVREEMRVVAKKVDLLATSFARTDEKLNSSMDAANKNLEKIKCFIDATNKRFNSMEIGMNSYKTEIKEIGKDLYLLKDTATRIRKKNLKAEGS